MRIQSLQTKDVSYIVGLFLATTGTCLIGYCFPDSISFYNKWITSLSLALAGGFSFLIFVLDYSLPVQARLRYFLLRYLGAVISVFALPLFMQDLTSNGTQFDRFVSIFPIFAVLVAMVTSFVHHGDESVSYLKRWR